MSDWMQTYSGKKIYPLAMNPEDICIEDIAHALSMLCRYGGHCKRFYSVAEHSVHLSYAVPSEFAFDALMHDATEAYLVDLPRPIKHQLPDYKQAEDNLASVIAGKFGLVYPMPPEVHAADNAILTDERLGNMTEPPEPWTNYGGPLGVRLRFWTPPQAEEAFTCRFNQLYTKGNNDQTTD